jgi:hypothetical protein
LLLGDKVIDAIAKKILGPAVDPSATESRKMARQGEIDAMVEEPNSATESLGKSEQDYIDHVVDRWKLFKSSLFFEKQKLAREKEELVHRLNVSLKAEEELILNEQKKEIDLLDVEMGLNSAPRKSFQEIYSAAEDQINELKSHLNRPLEVKFVKTYILLMAALSIAEVPVNRLAFELFFEQMPAVSLLLSAAVGLLFVFFAHIVGTQLKRSLCPLTALNKDRTYIAVFLITLSAIMIMYFLGLMREQLVETQAASSIDLSELLAQTSEPGADGSSKFNFLIGQKGVFLIIINFSIFLSGVLLAFYRHDSNPYYEDFSGLYQKSKHDLNNHVRLYEKKHVELLRIFKDRLNKNGALRFEIEKNLERISNHLDNIENQEDVFNQKVMTEVRLCISEYRKSNKQNRKTPAPSYFSKGIESSVLDTIA